MYDKGHVHISLGWLAAAMMTIGCAAALSPQGTPEGPTPCGALSQLRRRLGERAEGQESKAPGLETWFFLQTILPENACKHEHG